MFAWSGKAGQEQEKTGEQKQERSVEDPNQAQYTFKYIRKRVNLAYHMPDYLHFSMERTKNAVETFWNRAFYKIPLPAVFAKSRQGDQVSTFFLIYLYLDQWLENRYGEKYTSSFSKKKLTDEEVDSIQTFFQEKPVPYEWDFIQGWITFFFLSDSFSTVPLREKFARESFLLFLRAKEGKYREFAFQWAFFLMEMEPFFNFRDFHLQEAKNIVLARAQEGYVPAQYLQGVIEWKEGHPQRTIQWLKKAHDNNFRRNFALANMGLILSGEGDFAKAVPYLKSAIYEYDMEFLKPDLMFAYSQLSERPLAFQVAKEIGENYTRFSPENSLYAMEFLVVALSNGLGTPQDFEEAYVWLERLHYVAGENRILVGVNEEFVVNLRSQLSPRQIKEAERRALTLYRPAKTYSEMDETNPCAARYFH